MQARSPARTGYLAAGGLLFLVAFAFHSSSRHGRELIPLPQKCLPVFLDYQPSPWEAEWARAAEQIDRGPAQICKLMQAEGKRVYAWLNGTAGIEGQLDSAVFSQMVYMDPCRGGRRFTVPIEPLVGHFSHPRSLAPCASPSLERQVANIQDRTYLLLQGRGDGALRQLPAGRNLLLDLGTASYESSLGWFVEQYERRGLVFDEIWAWEVQALAPEEYWAQVPAAVRPRLHFYNDAVPAGRADPGNPLNIIKELWRPGDRVVLKLDVDDSALELRFVEQVLADPLLPSMLTEVFFEAHYSHEDMVKYFGQPPARWGDIFALFTKARRQGLRLHYWP